MDIFELQSFIPEPGPIYQDSSTQHMILNQDASIGAIQP